MVVLVLVRGLGAAMVGRFCGGAYYGFGKISTV
jgi:hypothetical protein